MSRRIEIELTSDRGDGTWTWRAAGARQPRGLLESTLLPEGIKAGDVLRAEVEVDIEGTTVTSVATGPARERTEPERIEILGAGGRDEDQLVTTQLAGRRERGESDRRERRDRPPRRDRGGEGRDAGRDRPPRREGEGGDRPRTDRSERGPRGDRSPRPEGGERREGRERRPAPPPMPERPKPKRLRPGRTHRKAVLDELSPEQQPIAEQVLKGGIPAVRSAIDAENEKRSAAGEPSINGKELLGIAEQLLPRLRTADWRDRAEAAVTDAGEIDLRDLRSVVVASDTAARDDETRALAAQLREKLDQRVEAEQATWLEDLGLALDAGRVVRALRLSSRPPKAGTILPPDLRSRLTAAACEALTSDVGADRWAAVLDAAAYAPVRSDVKPGSVPETPADDLVAAVRRYASRVPAVASAFGIEAPARPAGRSLRPPRPPRRTGTVPVPKREGGAAAIGAPVGAQPAPAAAEPEAGTDAPPAADVPAGAEAAAAPTPDPVQPSVAAAPVDVEPVATTPVEDAGVAEAAVPTEETAAEPTEPEDAAEEDPVVLVPPEATPEGPPAFETKAEPAAEVTGMPEAATPVDPPPPDGGEPDAEAALEAAPDLDDLSDGEPRT